MSSTFRIVRQRDWVGGYPAVCACSGADADPLVAVSEPPIQTVLAFLTVFIAPVRFDAHP
jgi:hypothetical protein